MSTKTPSSKQNTHKLQHTTQDEMTRALEKASLACLPRLDDEHAVAAWHPRALVCNTVGVQAYEGLKGSAAKAQSEALGNCWEKTPALQALAPRSQESMMKRGRIRAGNHLRRLTRLEQKAVSRGLERFRQKPRLTR